MEFGSTCTGLSGLGDHVSCLTSLPLGVKVTGFLPTYDLLRFLPGALLTAYIKELENSVETTRIGHAQALGALPLSMLQGQLHTVLSALISAAQPHVKDAKMASARQAAANAICRCCIDRL